MEGETLAPELNRYIGRKCNIPPVHSTQKPGVTMSCSGPELVAFVPKLKPYYEKDLAGEFYRWGIRFKSTRYAYSFLTVTFDFTLSTSLTLWLHHFYLPTQLVEFSFSPV